MHTSRGVVAALACAVTWLASVSGAAGAALTTPSSTTPAGQLVNTGNGALRLAGSLIQSDTGVGEDATTVADGTLFAGAPGATFSQQDQGAIFAYNEPAAGWSGMPGPSAVLTAAAPAQGGAVGEVLAAAGTTLVTGAFSPTIGDGQLLVFNRPDAGWSGAVASSATLAAPDGIHLYAPALSGTTIAALGQIPGGPSGNGGAAVFVFSEPAGGWSGTLEPSAALVPPNGTRISDSGSALAFSGTSIAAGSLGNGVFVFTEPSGGWSGSLAPSAVLDAGTGGWSVAANPTTIVTSSPSSAGAGADLFTEPAGGWRTAAPTAVLTPDGAAAAPQSAPLSFDSASISLSPDGHTVVEPTNIASSPANDLGEVLETFTEPVAGWSGTVDDSAILQSSSTALGWSQFDGSSIVAGTASAATPSPSENEGDAWFATPSGAADAGAVAAAGNLAVFTPGATGFSGSVQPTATYIGTPDLHQVLDRIPPTATGTAAAAAYLDAPGTPTASATDAVSADGVTVIAALGGPPNLSVYVQPANDWTLGLPAATLSDPAGRDLTPVALSDGTLLATATASPASEGVDLFTEPSDGWAGTLSPTARYTPNPGEMVVSAALSDGVLAVAITSSTDPGPATTYVFREGSSGWAPTLGAAATLASDAEQVGFDGTAITEGLTGTGPVLAGRGGQIFTVPKGGWHGDVKVSATLTAAGPTAAGDPTEGIYQEPSHGWTGTVAPTAEIDAAPGAGATNNGNDPADVVAVSPDGRALLLGEAVGEPADPRYQGAGTGELTVVSEPPSGWHGLLSGTPALEESSLEDPTAQFDGSDVVVPSDLADGSSVSEVYAVAHPPAATETATGRPGLSHAALTGTSTAKPSLRLDLTAATAGLPLGTVTVTPASGLTFSHSAARLREGVSACRHTRCTVTRAGQLTLALGTATATSLLLRGPALVESTHLRRAVNADGVYDANRHHRHKRSVAVSFRVTVTNPLRASTTLTARFSER